jgi:hypothetical protein
MTVPRTLRATVLSQPMASEQRRAEGLGAVLGPRQDGQQRSTTVPHGQPNRQLVSRIGRDRAGRPYMACKRSEPESSWSRRLGKRSGWLAVSRDELSGGPAKGVCDPLSKG